MMVDLEVAEWWACLNTSGHEAAVPRGWLAAEPTLAAYVRAARSVLDGQLSFHWPDHAGGVRRIDLVATALPGGGRSVEATVRPVLAPFELTVRELQVLTLVAGGLTNPDIATRLGTARRTVATHLERLLGKLDTPTRTAAAALAMNEHLLVLPIPGGPRGLVPLGVQQLDAAVADLPRTPDRRTHCRPLRKRPMTIGGVYPLHGPAAADGLGRRKATDLAVAEINRSGGIAGREVVHLAVEANVADQAELTSSVDAFVEREVDAITFGYTLARDDFGSMLAKAADSGCPVLHSATSIAAQRLVVNEPTRFGNVFQVCAPESRYGIGFIRTLNELRSTREWRPRTRRLLVLDSTDPHLTTFTDDAYAVAERSGWTVTAEPVDFLAPDWRPALDRLGADEPAAVMVATWIEPSLLDFLRHVRASGLPTLVYAVYAPSVPGFVDRAGPLAEELMWATVIGLYEDDLAGEFVHGFANAYHTDPGRSGAGIHYDMVHLLGDAWRQATNPHDHTAVTNRMRRIVHRGVSGAYYFGTPGQSALTYPDDTRDPSISQAHLVHQIQHGEHVIVAPMPYATGTFRPPGRRHAP